MVDRIQRLLLFAEAAIKGGTRHPGLQVVGIGPQHVLEIPGRLFEGPSLDFDSRQQIGGDMAKTAPPGNQPQIGFGPFLIARVQVAQRPVIPGREVVLVSAERPLQIG